MILPSQTRRPQKRTRSVCTSFSRQDRLQGMVRYPELNGRLSVVSFDVVACRVGDISELLAKCYTANLYLRKIRGWPLANP